MFKLSLAKANKQVSTIVCICLILLGCNNTPSLNKNLSANSIPVGKITYSYAQYLNLSNQAVGINKQAYLLLALRASLIEGKTLAADEMLARLQQAPMLSDDHQLELQLLQSLRFALSDNFELAIAALSSKSHRQVTSARLATLYKQRANLLLKNKQPLIAIASLVDALIIASTPKDKELLGKLIWQQYQQLSLEQLALADFNQYSDEHKGWHRLAVTSKESMHSPTLLRQQLAQWKLNFSTHSAVNNLPVKLVAAANVQPYTPENITIILPLTGKYSRIGQSVLNGILANLIKRDNPPTIRTIDSQQTDVVTALNESIMQDTDFIIGPLLKNNVAQITQLNTAIPTLFLNTPLDVEPNKNHYFFSMDKESEARQGAIYIDQLNKKRPVIVAPDNAQGHKIAREFSQQWRDLHPYDFGESNVESTFFAKDNQLKQTIEKLFETDKSQKRINHIRALVGHKLKSETYSRRDIDAIYLIANPKQTSMLMPSIRVTVNASANQVPVFIGSTGNAHTVSDSGLRHLDQLTLSEIPWLLQTSKQSVLPSEIKTLWPSMSHSQLRFFAMGHDAFGLIANLAQMQRFSEFKYPGLSGKLSLDEIGNIHREMSWAKFERGRINKL